MIKDIRSRPTTSKSSFRELALKATSLAVVVSPLIGEAYAKFWLGSASGRISVGLSLVLFNALICAFWIAYNSFKHNRASDLNLVASDRLKNLSASYEVMKVGVVIHDENLSLVLLNSAARRILCIPSPQLSTSDFISSLDLLLHEDGSRSLPHEIPFRVALRSQKSSTQTYIKIDPATQEKFWIKITSSPFTIGSASGVISTLTDITDLMRSQENILYVLENLGIGIWRYDLHKNALIWDPTMKKLFGIEESELQSFWQKWKGAATTESLQRTKEEFQKALAGEEDFESIIEIALTENDCHKIGIRGKIVKNAQGIPIFLQGINWDRTKELENESKLQRKTKLINTVLDNIPSMVFVKDASNGFRFSLLNRAGEKLLGLNSEKIIGKTDYDFFPKEQADFYTEKDRAVFASKSTLRIDQEQISTPGGLRWLQTYKVPTFNEKGEPDVLVGISTDITEDIRMREALEIEKSKSIHAAKLASLGEIAAGIAHEINNPLGIISGNLAIIKRDHSDLSSFEEKCAKIEKAISRITKIVTGLRKFARTTGSADQKPESIETIIREALPLIEIKSKQTATPVQTNLRSSSLILCDLVEIEQVIINLINNAIDAVKKDESRWVRVELFDSDGEVVLQVIDSGPGIASEVESKIFQPFYTTKPVGEGTGLGLSIAKGILDDHKAKFFINHSFLNTCFEIRFKSVGQATEKAA